MNVLIPGPKGLPISGNLLAFRKNPLEFLRKASLEYGDVVHFRFGPTRQIYLLSNPEHIKEVLVTKQASFRKGRGLQVARTVVGDGILTSEGQKHLRQRRLMQPAFHKERIASYGDKMVQHTLEKIENWRDGEEREINQDMMELTLRIITETMFGKGLTEQFADIAEAIDVGLHYVSNKATAVLDLPLSVPTRRNRQFQQSVETLNKVIYQIIEERRRGGDSAEHHDLLAMLLAARDEEDGTGMTDEQVRDEVMTIFLAGHETTANTMTWMFYLLSQNHDAEQKLFQEIDDVLAGKRPSVEDIPRLPYVNQVIMEAMRLYPAAWAINREVTKEVEIGGQTYQQGESIMMSQYVMHRNPTYYENPDQFIPERFAGDLLKRIPQFAYFPFGGGPRICIGNNFALMESALLLATIAQRFQLRMADNHPPVEPEPLVTLRPKHGVRMKLFKRV